MQNQNRHELKAANQKQKTKQKKRGRVAEVYELYTKGVSIKAISKRTKLDERVIRSYIWRQKNPDKFSQLLKRYQEKRKARLNEAKKNNPK
jgi:hypothetical protein